MPTWLDKLLKRKSSPELEDAHLEAFFTDVEHLRDVFHEFVTAPSLPKRLLVIHGVGGVGKSTLLRMYRLYCRRQGIPVALISGDEAKDAVGVLRGFAADLAQGGIKLSALERTLERYRAIQAKVEREGAKIAGAAVRAGAKAAVEMAASTIPVVGPVVGAFGGAGAEAFVDWLRSFLPRSDVDLYLDPAAKLAQDFVNDLTPVAEKRRLVLMLDTYEQMAGLDDWVRDLAQQLPSNVLTVIAGRAMPGAAWDRAWPAWMAQAHVEELRAMSEEDMRTLVRRYYATMRGDEPDPTQVEEIVRFARGLPMVITSAVRLWVRYGVHDFRAVKPQVVADLVDRLMEGTPPEMRPVLEVAATLRWFNKGVLRELLPAEQVEQVYDELRRFPFVRSRIEGLALHDVEREMLDENLKTHDRERHRMLHEQAAGYFEAQLAQVTGDEQERWTLERLYHRTRADEEAGIRLFQEMAEELLRYRLVNRLRALLNDVNTYLLERENSRLWREYFNARLAYLEARLSDTEEVYHAISENDQAEPKLRAYALCSLGLSLSRWQHLGESGEIEKVTSILEQGLSLIPLDIHLIEGITGLEHIYKYQGEWDKAAIYHEKALQFFKERGDEYGLAGVYRTKQGYHAGRGEWKEMFAMHELVAKASSALPKRSYFRAGFLGRSAWAWAFAGRYAEAEQDVREGLTIVQHFDDIRSVYRFSMTLGLLLAKQNRCPEATHYFTDSLQIVQALGEDYQTHLAYNQGWWGVLLTRQGKWDEAEKKLTDSLATREKFQLNLDIPEVLVWLGQLHEAKQEWDKALNWYNRSLEMKWTGRRNFECEALVGICRVKYQLREFAAIPPLLTEAEQLAQQHEYNDHLASLRLTQGHTAWEGHIPEWSSGFEAALVQYQQALIYALRYNRFLLDEVLWGGDVATPLRPIIPHCLERADEGHQMLVALHDWWQTGVNDIGTPRPDTISPIPEGIPLLEAERIAREREPGDGSPQQTVIEKIEAALATAPDS